MFNTGYLGGRWREGEGKWGRKEGKKKMQYSIKRINFEQEHEKRERGKKKPKQQVNNSNSSELNALIEEWIIILAQIGLE